MTTEELGMHIFIESSDQIIGKLAIDKLQKKIPSLDDLENAERCPGYRSLSLV